MKYPVLRICKHGEYVILRSPKTTHYKKLREEEQKLCKACSNVTSPQAR